MRISNRLEKLYHKDFKLIHTDLGLSNDIYIIELADDDKDVLRIPKKDIDEHVHRDLEREIQLALVDSGLDFEEVSYFKDEHIRITKFVEDIKTFKQCENPLKYHLVVDNIKKFHSLNLQTDVDFKLKEKYQSFLNDIKKPLIDYSQFEYIIQRFTEISKIKTLSHNDLVDGNLLFTKDHSYLIDYEYAGNNHPYFDLMSFLSENRIFDEDIRLDIYNYYFDNKLNDKIMKELRIIEDAQNVLWAAWANMLYNSRGNKIYKDIFEDKIEAIERKHI